jgi:MFS family permease
VLRESRFRWYWSAQVVSEVGWGFGSVALPLTAIANLGASPMDMGVLGAASQLPVLLFALHAGVWFDRLQRRPILVATNLGRGVLLTLVPLAGWMGWLQIEVLWGVAFAIGTLTVTFDIAATSYVPFLVSDRRRLIEANATLQAGGGAARIAGPAAGGWLVQAVGAPVSLLVQAMSFLVSAALLAQLHVPDDVRREDQRSVWTQIGEGIALVWRDPLLRAMVLSTAIAALGGSVQQAVYVLFVYRDLGVDAPTLGGIIACGSVAGLIGAASAERAARRLTAGGAMVAGQAAVAASTLLVLIAQPGPMGVVTLALAQVLFGCGLTIFSVTQISLRQARTPRHILGRVNATRRIAVFGVQPVGAVLGGALGSSLGLHAALICAAVVSLIALAAMAASPLRSARETVHHDSSA